MGTTPLVRWLATLDADALAEILAHRADAHDQPVPANLAELAERLSLRGPVAALFRTLPLPALQVLEVWQALADGTGGRVDRSALAAAFGLDTDDEDLAGVLHGLARHALVWPDGDRLHVLEPLRHAFAHPLGFGRPLAVLLAGRTAAELRRIAARWGRPAGLVKAAVLDDLTVRLASPEAVHAARAAAPAATRALLDDLAAHGPARDGTVDAAKSGPRGFALRPEPGAAWAVERGLLVGEGWTVEMPREVTCALRGPDWRPPFTPRPPARPVVAPDPDAVRRETTAAATAALDGVAAVLDACARTPAALRKQGGVGAREVRRLARASGVPEPDVRLALDLAAAAGLVATVDGEVLGTPAYDEWRAAEPAERLAAVLRAWWDLPALPGYETPDEPRPAPLMPDPLGAFAADLRHIAVRAAGSVELVGWYAPVPVSLLADAGAAVASLAREAQRLGVLAHGAPSPLGRALLDGGDRLDAAARDHLAPPASTAVFQADLTAVVAGGPAADLAELLDGCADREARGAASVWRFSASSVRRALDAGSAAADLLARLRAAAGGASLPQPLAYLVTDVARRHGAVRVRAVGSVVRCADEALAAELAGTKSLGLAALAPTVLASGRPPAETLAALRAAGYAPVGEDAAGVPVVERAPRRRAAPRPRRPASGVGSARPLTELAAALLAAPLPAAPATPPRPAADIALRAPQLSPGEVRLLADAVAANKPVYIRYTNARGVSSDRLIEPIDVDGHLLEAWCHLRDDERVFALARIEAVSPA